MCQQFLYSVSTVLPRDRVWGLFADIENWPKVSDVYNDLRWSGFPWTTHGCILGSIRYPHPLPLRYVIEKCEPGLLISYLAHSSEGGFATHRTIRFEQRHGRTWIEVDSYAAGEPRFLIAGGSYGFLTMLTERWFPDFARFCDNHAYDRGETHSRSFRMARPDGAGQSKMRY
jgi:hypothetical protein